MKDITRRLFFKKLIMLGIGFATGPMVVIKSLAAISPKETDAVFIFKDEVSRISPLIGKRLRNIEVLAQTDSFGPIIRGLIKINNKKGKYFTTTFPQKRFMEDLIFRQEYTENFVKNIGFSSFPLRST